MNNTGSHVLFSYDCIEYGECAYSILFGLCTCVFIFFYPYTNFCTHGFNLTSAIPSFCVTASRAPEVGHERWWAHFGALQDDPDDPGVFSSWPTMMLCEEIDCIWPLRPKIYTRLSFKLTTNCINYILYRESSVIHFLILRTETQHRQQGLRLAELRLRVIEAELNLLRERMARRGQLWSETRNLVLGFRCLSLLWMFVKLTTHVFRVEDNKSIENQPVSFVM